MSVGFVFYGFLNGYCSLFFGGAFVLRDNAGMGVCVACCATICRGFAGWQLFFSLVMVEKQVD
jgi:hypothetical protein